MVQRRMNGPLPAAICAETLEGWAIKHWTNGPPKARPGGEYNRTWTLAKPGGLRSHFSTILQARSLDFRNRGAQTHFTWPIESVTH